jgi:hypothetical protein
MKNINNILSFHHFNNNAYSTEHATSAATISEGRKSKGILAALEGLHIIPSCMFKQRKHQL